MQEPESPQGASPPPARPRKRRQKRTVYTKKQREELEDFFERNPRPAPKDREILAAKLNLQEHQVQVWFKNRRAKGRKMERMLEEQDPGAQTEPQGAQAEPQGAQAEPQRWAMWAAAPAPVPAGPRFQGNPVLPPTPVFPEEPVFPARPQPPGGPGFFSPPPPTPLPVSPEAQSWVFNYNQAYWDPAQSHPGALPSAPVPAPAQARVPPQVPYNFSFNPDPVGIPAVTEPRPTPLEGHYSSYQPWHEEEEEEGTSKYLNL